MKNIDNQGFSLIEVLIAMAIFAIGVGGLYSMQLTSTKGNTKANQQTGAVVVATQVVEQLMGTSYSSSALARTMTPNGTVVAPSHDSSELPNLDFDHAPYIEANDIIWDVINLEESNADNAGIKQVNLTITYQQGKKQVNITFLKIEMI